MVENKHSINTILSFGAKSVNPEILEQLLTGRNNTADFLENKVKSVVENGDNQFILVIGQRGMGKTHLLKVLHSRIWHYSQENKLTISYFAEEEYGVANFFDFLLRILNSFIKWYEQDSQKLKKELEKLQETSSANQLNYLEKIIKEYVGNKPLLIITENFGDILDQMGQEEQGRLRAWLYDNNNISIIASSQSVSDNFDREDRPFYGFFTPYYLKSLSFEESYDFLISLAEIEKNDKLIKHLKTKGKPQARAIFDLVKGNHRLLVTFYHFLKTDMLAKVSEVFIKTINDLKPYYETYIRYLPAQQQKILRYIALSRKPQLGVEISKNCFIEQKSLSKQLSELNKKRLVDIIPDPSDKRNKFYDISEPLLRISIEVGEHKEGITALFIDFLALYYNAEELLDRVTRISRMFEKSENTKDKQEFNYEIQAIKKAIEIKINLFQNDFSKQITNLLKQEKFEEIIQLVDSHNKNEKLLQFDKNLILIPISNLIFQNQGALDSYNFFSQIDKSIDEILENEKYLSIIFISKEEFIYQYASAHILYGDDKNDINILKKGINALKKIADENEKYNFLLLFANLILLYKEKNNNPQTRDLINHYYEKIIIVNKSNLNENELLIYYSLYMIVISFLDETNLDSELKARVQSSFINELNNYQKVEKIKIINFFSEVCDYWLWENIKEFLTDNISSFKETIINIFNNILSTTLTTNQVEELNTFVNKNKAYIKELAISEIYIKTYREVILNKNESALYELPKEQREFFEKNILKK